MESKFCKEYANNSKIVFFLIFQRFWIITSQGLLQMFPNQLYRFGRDIPHISKRTADFNRAKRTQTESQIKAGVA